MKTQDHTSCRGFSLVELLIVAAIIGLITAIAIPNLVAAIQRSRQTRTVSDARTISVGLGIYQQDYAKFPLAGSLADITTEIADSLAPFVGDIPIVDGWRNTFQYKSDGDTYTLCSYAMNGLPDQPWTNGFTSYFDDDIVIMDGEFMQIPEGVQN